MIAHARNREISPQKQTAQHVTNRRAELFFASGGEETPVRERDFDRFGQMIAVFEQIHWGSGGLSPHAVALFGRSERDTTGDQSCPLSTMRTTRSV